jgi:hypothetical protein
MAPGYAATLPEGHPRAGLDYPIALFTAHEAVEDAQASARVPGRWG